MKRDRERERPIQRRRHCRPARRQRMRDMEGIVPCPRSTDPYRDPRRRDGRAERPKRRRASRFSIAAGTATIATIHSRKMRKRWKLGCERATRPSRSTRASFSERPRTKPTIPAPKTTKTPSKWLPMSTAARCGPVCKISKIRDKSDKTRARPSTWRGSEDSRERKAVRYGPQSIGRR